MSNKKKTSKNILAAEISGNYDNVKLMVSPLALAVAKKLAFSKNKFFSRGEAFFFWGG